MSIGLIGAVVSVLCAGVLWAWTRSNSGEDAAVERDGVPGRWTFAVRVEGDDEAFARSILERSASEEDRVLDFIRLVPTASHLYAGEWTRAVRCDLPGGVLLRMDASHETGTANDLGEVLALLRDLGASANPKLRIAESSLEGALLRAVDETRRPGHHRCEHCRHSYVISELQCPNCGAPRRA